METRDAYNQWAGTYDTVENKTRDLELVAGKQVLTDVDYSKVLEIGAGTGKNTTWLSEKSTELIAVDFSTEMLNMAREKIKARNVSFVQSDITKPWMFEKVTLITCSLVLEHIQDLDFIFEESSKTLLENGCLYICELHPYKQLTGSRAKFQQGQQLVELDYFIHHISDFLNSAKKYGLQLRDLQEWFDSNDRSTLPRLVSFLFQKSNT